MLYFKNIFYSLSHQFLSMKNLFLQL